MTVTSKELSEIFIEPVKDSTKDLILIRGKGEIKEKELSEIKTDK